MATAATPSARRIYCAGMLRSASTWQYNVAADLLEGCGVAERGGFVTGDRALEERIATGRSLVVKLHRPCDLALEDARRGAKVLYIHRDLRDVAASAMRVRRFTLEEMLGTGVLDNARRFREIWTALPAVLVQRYEDVLADPAAGVAEIAAFLGLGVPRERIEAVTRANGIDAMRARADERARMSLVEALLHRLRPRVGRVLRRWLGWRATHALGRRFRGLGRLKVDPDSLLMTGHIGDGSIGCHQRILTPAEQRRIEAWIREEIPPAGTPGPRA
jgi:hypothetical protein